MYSPDYNLDDVMVKYLEIQDDPKIMEQDEYGEAWEIVDDLVRARNQDSVDLILNLVEKANSHKQLYCLGAGIIEDLIGKNLLRDLTHKKAIAQLVVKAQHNPKLCFAISTAWEDPKDEEWQKVMSNPLIQKFRKLGTLSADIDTSEFCF